MRRSNKEIEGSEEGGQPHWHAPAIASCHCFGSRSADMIEDGGATVRDDVECSNSVDFCPLPSQKLWQQNIILLRRRWQSGMQHEWTRTHQRTSPLRLEGVPLSPQPGMGVLQCSTVFRFQMELSKQSNSQSHPRPLRIKGRIKNSALLRPPADSPPEFFLPFQLNRKRLL